MEKGTLLPRDHMHPGVANQTNDPEPILYVCESNAIIMHSRLDSISFCTYGTPITITYYHITQAPLFEIVLCCNK